MTLRTPPSGRRLGPVADIDRRDDPAVLEAEVCGTSLNRLPRAAEHAPRLGLQVCDSKFRRYNLRS